MSIASTIRQAWSAVAGSDLVRRVFSSRRFRDNEARRNARPPTVSDRADVSVRQISGDQYVLVFDEGREHLSQRLDSEMNRRRDENNPVLPKDARPSMSDIIREAMNQDEDGE